MIVNDKFILRRLKNCVILMILGMREENNITSTTDQATQHLMRDSTTKGRSLSKGKAQRQRGSIPDKATLSTFTLSSVIEDVPICNVYIFFC